MSSELFSSIQIWPVTSAKAGSLLANGKCIVAGTIKVNFTVMKGPKGPFAAFPSQKVEKDGKVDYFPYMNLLDDTTKASFQTAVLEVYNTTLAEGPAAKPAAKSAAVPF